VRRLPLTLGVLAVLLGIPGAGAMAVLDGTGPGDLVVGAGFGLLGVASAATGVLVASRVPGNAVGWIILGLGLGVGLLMAAGTYAEIGLTTRYGPLPAQREAAWFGDVAGVPIFFGLTGLLLLLFPDGRPLSPRWRAFAWIYGVTVGLASLSYALMPGPVGPGVANPHALDGTPGDVATFVGATTDVLALPALVTCAVGLVVRVRRSSGVERQQLKLFSYVAVVAGLGLGISVFTSGLVADGAFLAGLLGVTMMPVAAGVAILRHGLYDIDVVIKRTLVYGPLAGALLGTYLVLVLGLQAVLPVEGESDLAVAGSTLAVAALFRPLRDRLRAVVDRRFYRSRYDAALTLESFGARLRHQVDLEVLGGDLRSVVHDTMQPAHVTLWLRGSA
jgi:hypothetical protein